MTNKKHPLYRALIMMLASFIIIFAGSFCYLLHTATSIARAASTECSHVYDGIDLFSTSQINELESLAKKYSEKRDLNFLIVTTNYESGIYDNTSDPIMFDTEDYSEAFYDEFVNEYGSDYKDCVIFTINIVDPDNSYYRYADVSGQGEGKTKMDDERCSLLFDHLKEDLSAGDYYSAACEFVTRGSKYVKVMPGINPDSIFLQLWFQLLVSIVVSLIIILIMASHSKGKMTVSGNNYLDRNNARILGHYDRYIRTTTTKVKIESSSGGGHGGHGGGGGGHSGGGSHGGGHF